MHSEEMSARVARFLGEADELQKRKNPDYHPERVAYLEVLRTAWECGITVEQDLWAKIRKQYVALHSFVIHGNVESEPPRSRMIDVAVYMGMLAVWIECRDRVVIDAFNYVRDQVVCEVFGGKGSFDTDEKSTCVRQGRGGDSRCPRCQFLMWLGNRHAA